MNNERDAWESYYSRRYIDGDLPSSDKESCNCLFHRFLKQIIKENLK